MEREQLFRMMFTCFVFVKTKNAIYRSRVPPGRPCPWCLYSGPERGRKKENTDDTLHSMVADEKRDGWLRDCMQKSTRVHAKSKSLSPSGPPPRRPPARGAPRVNAWARSSAQRRSAAGRGEGSVARSCVRGAPRVAARRLSRHLPRAWRRFSMPSRLWAATADSADRCCCARRGCTDECAGRAARGRRRRHGRSLCGPAVSGVALEFRVSSNSVVVCLVHNK